MHSSLVRLQNVFGFFTSVAFAVAMAVAASSYLYPTSPTAEVSLRSVQVVKGRPHYHSHKKEEYAHIKFDIEADLTSLFNWNTKQVFVWVQATYPSLTPESPMSEAIIWDQIINSHAQQNSPWTMDNARSYFPFIDSLPFLSGASSKTSKAKSKAARAKESAKAKAKAAAAKAAKAAGVSSSAVGDAPLPGRISLKNAKSKYQITDVSGKLADRQNVTLEIGWNVQPWVGLLTWTLPEGQSLFRWQGVQGGRSKSFDMPALKGKKPEVVGSDQAKGAKPKAGKAEPVVGHQH